MIQRIFFALAVIFFAGCVSKPKNAVLVPEESAQQPAFDRGLQALDAERFAEAAQIFDALLLENPGTEMDLVALFDSGVAYENMGECHKAADRYRRVVRSSAGKFKRIEGEALFRLSLAYECMGQDVKTITALLDAKRRGKQLSFETVNAELPARLAAAYARLGNRTKALEYFNKASQGLKATVARAGGHVQKDLLARTMYLMGKLSPAQRAATADYSTYLQSFGMQQPYLLQAMEFARPIWSGKAGDDLKTGYDNIWKFKIEDPEKRREFYTRGLQTINELRKIRLNKPDPNIDAVFAILDQTESRLQNELAKDAEINKLTPSAERREGLRQNGKLVTPKIKKPRAKK